MPLMLDWNQTFRKALDEQDSALSTMVGIHHDQAGPDFEKAIGDFLTWQRSIDLSARYLPLGLETPWQIDGSAWGLRSKSRAEMVIATLTRTLNEQFGGDRISSVGAKSAYGSLLESINLRAGGNVTIATTNYDPSIEIALAELRKKPDVGAAIGPSGLIYLEPDHLIDQAVAAHGIAVLHLHGMVGWYTQDDRSVRIYPAHQPFNESAGTPTVLWPDPNKDPMLEPAITRLWDQFDIALQRASDVLVLGHSFHDDVLVDRLRTAAGGARKAVCAFTAQDSDMATKVFPEATLLGVDFGPTPNLEHIKSWAA